MWCQLHNWAKETYFKPFYEGGYRQIIGGVPVRLALHVKGWRGANKRGLAGGYIHGGASVHLDGIPAPAPDEGITSNGDGSES